MGRGTYPRPIRQALIPVGPSIAYIPMTCGLFSLVDREDADFLGQFNWCTLKKGNGRAVRRVNGTNLHMSRVLCQSDYDVDHINGNTLDNRRSNLRPATRRQNCQNRKGKVPLKGAFFNKEKRKWKSAIYVDGKFCHLGYFETAEAAHSAYAAAAVLHYGEFARWS